MRWIRRPSICVLARFRRRKAAVQLHTLLDLRGNIPAFLSITDGKVHDVNVLDEIVPEVEGTAMDRGHAAATAAAA